MLPKMLLEIGPRTLAQLSYNTSQKKTEQLFEVATCWFRL